MVHILPMLILGKERDIKTLDGIGSRERSQVESKDKPVQLRSHLRSQIGREWSKDDISRDDCKNDVGVESDPNVK